MTERQQQFEAKLDNYAQSLADMQQHVQTLQQNVSDMMQVQFGKLASVITDKLHLQHDQAETLQQILDEHLQQITAATQMQLPGGTSRITQPTPQTFTSHVMVPQPPTRHNRDPRLTKHQQ